MEDSETKTTPSVGRVALRYGIIMGLISIVYALLLIVIGVSPYENSWWKGLISFAILVGVIVYAHKYYKDSGDGFMMYGQGFGVAMLACLVSLVIGFIFNFIFIKFIDTHALDVVYDKTRQQMEERGSSDEQVEMAIGFTKRFFWAFYIFFAILFSLVVSLIVPIFTQKQRKESAF